MGVQIKEVLSCSELVMVFMWVIPRKAASVPRQQAPRDHGPLSLLFVCCGSIAGTLPQTRHSPGPLSAHEAQESLCLEEPQSLLQQYHMLPFTPLSGSTCVEGCNLFPPKRPLRDHCHAVQLSEKHQGSFTARELLT